MKILVHGDTRAEQVIRATSGVAVVEPMFVTEIRLAGRAGYIWAVRRSTMFHYRVVDGRWYTPAEEQSATRVAVLERNLANASGSHVGDNVLLETSNGPLALRVIGIASNQQENGTAFFVPHSTMRQFFGATAAAGDDYWVRMTSAAHPFIDRTTTRIEDALAAAGYDVGTEIEYVEEANNVASNRTVTTTVAMLGFLIVAISMVGLANAITMSVIERTREIGILRTIGARARDVRRIFATESVAIALAGWLVGIPLGYVLERFLVWMVREIVNVQVPVVFPLANIGLALAGTIVLALLITLLPIRRAVRYRPGQALRYA